MDLEAGIYKDDPDFEEAIDKLSSNLFQISSTNGRISELLRRQQQQRSGHGAQPAKDSLETSDQAMRLVQNNQILFRQLKPEIEEMQLWPEPSPSQKYSQHKLAADFARLFAEFRQLQEWVLSAAKSQHSTPSTRKSNNIELWEQPREANEEESALLQQDQLEGDDDVTSSVWNNQLAFDEQLRQDEVSYQQGLVADREQEIENITQGMNELNEIYTNLGQIVREQGVTLDSIEHNMYNVASDVRGGSQQLTKAHSWQRSSSARMCCFLIILLVLLLIVVVAVTI